MDQHGWHWIVTAIVALLHLVHWIRVSMHAGEMQDLRKELAYWVTDLRTGLETESQLGSKRHSDLQVRLDTHHRLMEDGFKRPTKKLAAHHAAHEAAIAPRKVGRPPKGHHP